nr:carbohydrate-binding family 9-like protein [Wocania arenilitoris]
MFLFSITFYAQSKKEIIPQTYVAHKTSELITIDGKANESDWKNAKWTSDFIDIESDKTPKYQTRVKMLWDDNYYYIFAEMKEPHVWGDITQRDAVIFYNNDFEVFIDTNGDTHNYYELEINALNTVWDLFLIKPYGISGSRVLNNWDYSDLKSAINIKGTLNNPNDIDKGWTLEIAIPFKDFRKSRKRNNIPSNQFYRVNFSRVNWDFDLENGKYSRKKNKKGRFLPEYNWVWSPMGVINMHKPEKWGYVYFSSKEVGSNVTFEIPKDEKIKWKLYELFHANRTFQTKNNQSAKSISDLEHSKIIIDEKEINPTIETYKFGWTISVQSPFTNHILSVKEDGKFLKKK